MYVYDWQRTAYFDVGFGIDFVHCISWSPACLIVEEVALYEHAMIGHTPHPNLPLALLIQYHACGMGTLSHTHTYTGITTHSGVNLCQCAIAPSHWCPFGERLSVGLDRTDLHQRDRHIHPQ